jgi:hypothetical protein
MVAEYFSDKPKFRLQASHWYILDLHVGDFSGNVALKRVGMGVNRLCILDLGQTQLSCVIFLLSFCII